MDENVKSLIEIVWKFEERIKNLEQHKHYQVDKNRKEDRRIEALEQHIKFLDSENKMRQDTADCIDKAYDQVCCDLEKRLKYAEELLLIRN